MFWDRWKCMGTFYSHCYHYERSKVVLRPTCYKEKAEGTLHNGFYHVCCRCGKKTKSKVGTV